MANHIHESKGSNFEITSKRRKGFPSETRVKRGIQVVPGFFAGNPLSTSFCAQAARDGKEGGGWKDAQQESNGDLKLCIEKRSKTIAEGHGN